MTSTPPSTSAQPPARDDTHAAGQTADRAISDPAPKLPHERDQSTGEGGRRPGEVETKAHADATGQQQDTDRSETTDEIYRKTLKSPTGTQAGTAPEHETTDDR